jgi:hypothetical protein
VVRGPAAVLTASAGALLYLELAPSLPAPGDDDLTTLVGGCAALVVVALVVLALVEARNAVVLLALFATGGGLVAGALQVAQAGAAADAAKLLFAGALGMLLARLLDTPPVIVAVPVFVAGIALAGTLSSSASPLVHDQSQMADFVTISLPRWGGRGETQLSLSDVIFLAFFAAGAWRYGFRRRATAAGLFLGLGATLAAGVAAGRELPVLPGLAVGLLAPNIDRVLALLQRRVDA